MREAPSRGRKPGERAGQGGGHEKRRPRQAAATRRRGIAVEPERRVHLVPIGDGLVVLHRPSFDHEACATQALAPIRFAARVLSAAKKAAMADNLITDVPGVRVGSADDPRLASGVTAIIFDRPAIASVAAHGGAPAFRDTAMLEPEMTVERVDGFVLSGGSAFGLDAPGGAMAYLASIGRGFPVRTARVPIVPGASLFDLTNGGDKAWGRKPPYWELGYQAAEQASRQFALGTVGAGYGATTFDLKGGLGSASAVTSSGFLVGAVAVANTVGRATRGKSHHFWAAPYERDGEFGGHTFGPHHAEDAHVLRMKNDEPTNTDLAVVATDAALTKAQVKRIAIMAQDGFALAVKPAHAPTDGDAVFAVATETSGRIPDIRALTEIGMLAAECVARAIARGVYEATALGFPGSPPSWRDLHGQTLAAKRDPDLR